MREEPKRLGKAKSTKRAALVEAAEQILQEQGHAALSARYLAEKAGIKFQSIYYYFNTLDDLIMEVFERSKKRTLERIEQQLASKNPLRALWQHHLDQSSVSGLFPEFTAMAKDNKRIRDALTALGEQARQLETDGLARYLAEQGVDLGISAEELTVLMSSVTRNLRLERAVNISWGHAAIQARVEDLFKKIEGADKPQPQPRRRRAAARRPA